MTPLLERHFTFFFASCQLFFDVFVCSSHHTHLCIYLHVYIFHVYAHHVRGTTWRTR